MKPRLLANENFPAPSVQHLRDRGYDVTAVADGGGGLKDPEVLTLAVTEQRWIVTFDFEGHFVIMDEAGFRKRPLPEQKPVRG